MQADRPIKPQPTNEKCWRQADRRIKSDQPIRESRVFRAQTARQLANQRKQGLSRPNCEAAGSDYKKALRENSAVSASLRQTPPGSVRLRRASQSCDCDQTCNFAGLCSRAAGLTHRQTSLERRDTDGHEPQSTPQNVSVILQT